MTWFKEVAAIFKDGMDAKSFNNWEQQMIPLYPSLNLEVDRLKILLMCLSFVEDRFDSVKFASVAKSIAGTKQLLEEYEDTPEWEARRAKWSVKAWAIRERIRKKALSNDCPETWQAENAAGVAEWAAMDRKWSVGATIWVATNDEPEAMKIVSDRIIDLCR